MLRGFEMYIGTSYFKDLESAIKYYKDYDCNKTAVLYKIKCGEIHIGKPELKSNEVLLLNKEEGRYFINVKTSNLPLISNFNNWGV